MKRFLLTALTASVAVAVFADPIGREEASNIASVYLNSVRPQVAEPVFAVSQNEVKSIRAYGVVDEPAFYVFNAADGKGFVVVSGDDDFPKIIGYSNEGFFPSDGQMPEGLNDFLSSYSQYVADVRSGIADAPLLEADKVVSADYIPVVGPLCTSKWSQSAPYNMYAPKIGSTVCPVGCVATAMSQLMYFWKYPEKGQGQVSYTVPTYNIPLSADLSQSVYDWANMADAVTNSSSDAAKAAVAQLCYDAGVSVSMQYAPASSGAYDLDAMSALVHNFGYSSSSIRMVYKECYATTDEWKEVMKSELDEGRPVYFSAVSPGGGGVDAGGHAFVVDGYDTDDFAHVNWGWGGQYNGYFSLTRMNPGGYAFTSNQSMIIGIKPAVEGETPAQAILYLESAPKLTYTSKDRDAEFQIYLAGAYNMCNPDAASWLIGVGLYKPNGEFVADVCTDPESTRLIENVAAYQGFGKGYLPCKIPADIPDGDYVLKFNSKEVGFDTWALPAVVGGAAQNEFPVWVTSSELRFDEVSAGIDDVDNGTADVVSTEWFDLSGRKVEAPVKGQTYVERVTLSNGKVESTKKIF